jgi:hypothetical protein
MKTKKYDYHNIEEISEIEFKYAMIATAILILLHFGFIGESLGNFLWIITTTGLATYVWYAFRLYFVKVNDHQTAKWILAIMAVIVLHGLVNLLFYLTTSMFDNLPTNNFALTIFEYLFYLVLLSLVVFIAVCIKIIAVNKHHSFGLKRIALSALFCIPIYFLISSIGNIHFIWEAREVMDIVFERGQGGYLDPQFGIDMFSGVFSFFNTIWTIFIMIPYFFLFFHFMKADR